ncbi:PDZ domain-containing protein [Bradyrhizobium sp. Ec3.3]|uniref:PDZ domain-containing protein n=1 Tax=Bradyrhizobium sp. Ec3.3 TaxID=189753 RepID=UPI0012EBA934|nr:PDZ domain-containing protein [Bradyrhizobium sp. Ec3.3]
MIRKHLTGLFGSLLLFMALGAPASGLDLGRRALLGITASPLRAGVDSIGPGVLAERVIAGSPAAQAGVVSGDVVVSVDGKPLGAVDDFLRAVGVHRAGDTVPVELRRAGQPLTLAIKLDGVPFETAPGIDFTYDAVATPTGLRRTIMTSPQAPAVGRRPAVLLIGGIGTYSVDYSFDPDHDVAEPYRRLLAALTRRGFVTLRVEKSGVGDSEGPPAKEVDLDGELVGYIAGLKMLKARADVDPERVFILGHSIGSVEAPMAAAREPVRGIVVMQGVGTTWFEYELVNVRRQLELEGIAPAEVAKRMALKEWAMHRLLIDGQPRAALLAERPAAAAMIKYPASDAYLRNVAALNLPALWAPLDLPVLVVYGNADFITSEADSRAILEDVNRAHPGRGELRIIDHMDHYLTDAADQATSFKAPRAWDLTPARHPAYQAAVEPVVGDWLVAQAGRSG